MPIQLFFQLKHKEKLDDVTLALHAVVLDVTVLQVTCLRFGTNVIFRSLFHVAWVSKLAADSFFRQSAGFLEMERAVFKTFCL